jgi:site-specific DNA-methyltransferase (adenine-specific)
VRINIEKLSDLELLKKTKSNSVDLIFLDPPFNVKKNYDQYVDNLSEEDYYVWQKNVLLECKRVLSESGNLIYHNIPKHCIILANYMCEINMVFHNWICWDNAGSMPTPSRLYPKHYPILWFSKTKKKIFNKQYTPVQRCRTCDATVKDYGGKYKSLKEMNGNKVTVLSDVWSDIHRLKHRKNKHRKANELPYKLMERIILMYSNENSVVLDLYLGTGTSAEVCIDYNRKFSGCDISSESIKQSNERVNKGKSE